MSDISGEQINSIDPNLFAEFLSESIDVLDGIDSLFVQLEETPDNLDIVDKIFRPIHSIKGNSSFFGMVNVKTFSHAMENLMQQIRSRKRVATPAAISILLVGIDTLRDMIQRFMAGNLSTEMSREELSQLEELKSFDRGEDDDITGQASEIRAALDRLSSVELTDESKPIVDNVDKLVRALLKRFLPAVTTAGVASDNDATYAVGKTMVTEDVKAAAGFVKEIETADSEEVRCEQFLASMEKIKAAARAAGKGELVAEVDAVVSDFEAIHDSGLGFDQLLGDLIREKFEACLKHIEISDAKNAGGQASDNSSGGEIPENEAREKQPENGKAPASRQQSAPSNGGGKTLRIAEEKVDGFMAYVGELIIAGEVFAYIQKKIEHKPEMRAISQEFKNANIAFGELSTNLQKSLMEVRRIPLQNIMQKLPRIVRDTSGHIGKDVELHIEGGNLQVDKALVEGLENPLVHMVRNSVDHGIEPPHDREAAGKPRKGNIWLRASATEDVFKLVIQDDGHGLDIEKIKEKAVAQGNITREQAAAMTDAEAFRLIFNAGVSTAKQVTEISGRGVGMDVVMSNIRELNGQVDVESTLGEGTRITITLPMTVTLLVIDGMVSRVGKCDYIIPLSDILESVRIDKKSMITVSGKGEAVNVRGSLYPLIRLYDVLGLETEIHNPEDSTIILVQSDGRVGGLMVDDILGQQSVVLKNLGERFRNLRTVQGGAILGDGRVGLVLDVEGLLADSVN